MTAKSILESRTFWFNVVAALVGTFIGVAEESGLAQALEPFWAPAVAVVNIGLRFITNQPVKLPG